MRWLKVFLISLFIGFYFLSITPIHFYAHDFNINHSKETKKLEDCTYINLLQTGQGNYLDSDVLVVSDDAPTAAVQSWVAYPVLLRLEDNFFYNFNLRGPPTRI